MRLSTRRWCARVAALSALVVAAVALAGCSTAEPTDREMQSAEVWGYVADKSHAQLQVPSQSEADMLLVSKVLTPVDGWIVVHLDDKGMPGARVGLKRIPRGESINVKVPLDGVTTTKVIVSVHADKGTPEKFDFDMMRKEMSPDRPLFVSREELAEAVAVKQGEAAMPADQASETAAGPMDPASTQDGPADAGSSGEAMPQEGSDAMGESSGDGDAMGESSGDGDAMGGSSGEAMPQEGSDAMGESSGDGDAMGGSEAASEPAWGVLTGFLILNAGIIAFAAILRRRGAAAKPEGS